MTNKEAIERIKEFGLYHAIKELPNSARTVEAFKMAIDALGSYEGADKIFERPHKDCVLLYKVPFEEFDIYETSQLHKKLCRMFPDNTVVTIPKATDLNVFEDRQLLIKFLKNTIKHLEEDFSE